MRGRKPKPSALKVFHGNPGKRAISKDEPRAEPGIPQPPPHIQGETLKLWHELGAMVAALGVLTKADVLAFEALVRAYQHWRSQDEALAKLGAVLIAKTPDGRVMVDKQGLPILRRSPYAVGAENAQIWLHRWLSEFGLTPAARARVAAAPSPENDAERKMFGG